MRTIVDDYPLVTEHDIARAMAWCVGRVRLVVEGGGAVGLAGLLSGAWAPEPADAPLVVVLSGGNVAPEVLAEVVERHGP